jgi:hypothetical protein
METCDELKSLRRLLAALDSRSITMGERGVDVTQREKEKLRADVDALERRLSRGRFSNV